MNIKKALLFLSAFLTLFSSAVILAKSSPDLKEKLAHQYVITVYPKDAHDIMLAEQVNALVSNMHIAKPDLNVEEARKKLYQVMDTYLPYDAYVEMNERVLLDIFSLQEIQELSKLVQKPVLKKYISKYYPKLTEEFVQYNEKALTQLMHEVSVVFEELTASEYVAINE